MSFEGDKFFSYGTCIAQRVKTKAGRFVYLVSSSRYSSTSSMHQGLVKNAIPKSARTVYVPGCDRWVSGTFFDHARILKEMQGGIEWRTADAAKAREPKKSRLLREAKAIQKRRKAYAEMFGVKL